VAKLRPLHAAEVIEDWLAMAAAGDFETLADNLMEHHYDPRYEKHRARFAEAAVVEAARLDAEGLEALAADVAAAAETLALPARQAWEASGGGISAKQKP